MVENKYKHHLVISPTHSYHETNMNQQNGKLH